MVYPNLDSPAFVLTSLVFKVLTMYYIAANTVSINTKIAALKPIELQSQDKLAK